MKPLKTTQGMSIIEVTVALGVLCIIGLGVNAIFGAGNKNSLMVAHANEATSNAFAGMELAKSIPYSQLPPAGTYTTETAVPAVIAPIVKDLTLGKNTVANCRLTIKNIDDPAGGETNDYKEITVTVSWQDGNTPRERLLVSYMAQR